MKTPENGRFCPFFKGVIQLFQTNLFLSVLDETKCLNFKKSPNTDILFTIISCYNSFNQKILYSLLC